MKDLLLFLSALLLSVIAATQPLKPERVSIDTLTAYGVREKWNNYSFRAGEKLTYRVHYGFVDAGEAVIEIRDSKYRINGRDCYYVLGTGQSLGAFDWFFRVRDRYETFIDKDGIFPHRFIRDVDEGGYKIKQDYVFHQSKRAVTTHKKETFATPEAVQDMISAFYYARTIDFSNARKGDLFTITVFMDNEIYPLRIKYMGKETIKVRAGKFRCMKFVPVVQEGRVFKSEEDLNVWVTDDANKIPILVKSNLLVGSIKMEVTKFEGLANPLAKVN